MSKQSRLNKEKAAKAKAAQESQGNTGSNHNRGADQSRNYNNEQQRHPQKSEDRVNQSRS